MPRSFRSLVSWLPHLPWIAAVFVLVVGIIGWSARPTAPEPEPELPPPPIEFNREAFRQALHFDEEMDNPLAELER